jgi:hypothetical protein
MSFKEVVSRPFTMAWLAWIVGFLFIEGVAIFSKIEHATFSAHVRDFLRHQPWYVMTFFWAFMVWLTVHFLVGLRS